ncbi:AAA family ATPase [Nakamurella sp. YIM 132087]|uniref:AAA family ATPase n=1 Tax=Nakamurella alba TaxID=2665158 RepID=A0A7K1FHY2_9ACTN|nr:AAA family ATPase [Nakamurella alba]MTD13049.1 AAA family ATPase [Nakamurella alba]
MRLHRLVLDDYRGINHREITFPASGVVIVEGANEVGKTSMIEALDLLLEERDSSAKQSVKAVRPAGRDVGSSVEAEISVGEHRFVYRKRWNRGASTDLRILQPAKAHWTGREAHDKVRAILAEHLDDRLFKAQRVLQTAPLEQGEWSGSTALATALDRAAGATADDPDETLPAAVEAEYRRHFTAGGRPTGEYRDLLRRVDECRAEVSAAAAELGEIAVRVGDHDRIEGELAGLVSELRDRSETLAGDEQRLAAARALVAQLAAATDSAGEAERFRDRASADRRAREEIVRRVDDRTAAVIRLADRVAASDAAAATAATALERAGITLAAIGTDVQTAAARAESALARADLAQDRADLLAVTDTLDAVAVCERDIAAAGAALAAHPVDDRHLRAVEGAANALSVATDVLQTSVTRLTVARPDGGPLLMDRLPVTADGALTLGDGTEIRWEAPAQAGELARTLEAAEQQWQEALTACGATDLADARRRGEIHRAAVADQAAAQRALRDLTGSSGPDELRARAALLRGRIGAGPPPGGPDDPDLARAASREARAEHAALQEQERQAASALHRAERESAAVDKERAVHRAQQQTAHVELESAREQLALARADQPDSVLDTALLRASERADSCADAVRTIREALGSTDVAVLDRTVAHGRARVADLQRRSEAAAGDLRTIAAELAVIGGQGRQERYDRAMTDLAAAEAEAGARTSRAGAAQLLRDTLLRHREDSRARYVAPFRAELRRLGKLLYGADFDVEVDPGLVVTTRTLDGVTLPFGALSSGAKEQLAVLIRLACAGLVGGEHGTPVLVDDALGFSDPERLGRIGEVLTAVGGDSQIVLMTCTPDRYRSVRGATVLRLRADGSTHKVRRRAVESVGAVESGQAVQEQAVQEQAVQEQSEEETAGQEPASLPELAPEPEQPVAAEPHRRRPRARGATEELSLFDELLHPVLPEHARSARGA